jgi:bifunctional UDP-N-acetylglucosamine pyrophosphorylase/glucosamine-1-phosphate N-acetyltransferase
MRRTLLVPAAGEGRRLGSPLPKLLTPVAGRPMIDWIIGRHAPFCSHVVLVVHPSAAERVARHFGTAALVPEVVLQPAPTGMLDAILAAHHAVLSSRPDRVWITWCDQVAISQQTAERLAALDARHPPPAAALPTTRQRPPYIHLERNEAGAIAGVRQRREGDQMPDEGESDAGLFSLAIDAFATALPAYAREAVARGARTGERNFLPFLPWLAVDADVATFEVDPAEARGVNTPDDLAIVERHLRQLAKPLA